MRAGELRKQGSKVKLQEKPFQLLTLLLEHPGEVVTRDELQKSLWPDGTFVDFDHSLGSAVGKVRQALGDSAQNPRFIETLGGRGYRFIAPVQAMAQVTESTSDREANGSHDSAVPVRPRRPPEPGAHGPSHPTRARPIVMAAMVALAATLAALVTVHWRDRILGRHEAIKSLAVLPLENLSRDPDEEYFADGMTDELITALGQIAALRVIWRTSVMAFKGQRKPLGEIARELGVDAVVEGTVLRSDNRVRITAQLIRAKPEAHLWAESYERDLKGRVGAPERCRTSHRARDSDQRNS